MVSRETKVFLISSVVGLIALFGLATLTNLPTLVRVPIAVIVALLAQPIIKSFGQ